MNFHRITPHPRFAELKQLLRVHPDWFHPWSGTFFRFQTINYPAPGDVLSGAGARDRGGRWNPPGLATLYGSLTDVTALEESKANDRYYGLETRGPRLLVAIEAHLTRHLNLTTPAIRAAIESAAGELSAEDWRKLLEKGQESLGQALGRAVATMDASGLLAPSTAVPGGLNIAVFPRRPADHLEIIEGEKLAKIGVRTRT